MNSSNPMSPKQISAFVEFMLKDPGYAAYLKEEGLASELLSPCAAMRALAAAYVELKTL